MVLFWKSMLRLKPTLTPNFSKTRQPWCLSIISDFFFLTSQTVSTGFSSWSSLLSQRVNEVNHFLLLDFTSSSRVESFHHPLFFLLPSNFLSAKHILWLKKGCELCNGPNSFLSDLVLKVTPFWCHFQAWFWSFYNNSSCFLS